AIHCERWAVHGSKRAHRRLRAGKREVEGGGARGEPAGSRRRDRKATRFPYTTLSRSAIHCERWAVHGSKRAHRRLRAGKREVEGGGARVEPAVSRRRRAGRGRSGGGPRRGVA